jgi:hypothetical protein
MVKHPRYQAMDNARQHEIPVAFDRHNTGKFRMKKIEPREPKERIPGPLPRPTFQVLEKNGNLVAFFHPNGHAECRNASFRVIFDKMQRDIEEAASETLDNFEKGL